eukprot:scaffold19530_cov60-Phaeocystis_antarctica.AAC.2
MSPRLPSPPSAPSSASGARLAAATLPSRSLAKSVLPLSLAKARWAAARTSAASSKRQQLI